MESTTQTSEKMREEVLQGLKKSYKTLPCKYLYDERGSELFDQICEIEEYYPTRTELKIMEDNLAEILKSIPDNSILIELGSGSSLKTRLLLDNHQNLAGYVPVDISEDFLLETAEILRSRYTNLTIYPVVADYTHPFEITDLQLMHDHIVVYYPGSTIGNFLPEEAETFLKQIHGICENDGGLLIGVDLKKDPEVLEAAYNDSKGITAAFNKNILTRLNRELNADFNIDDFQHQSVYNKALGRVEMHLISRKEQDVCIDDEVIHFKKGESIHTENSYKYELGMFEDMAASAGFQTEAVWTDEKQYFGVLYLRRTE